MSKLSADVKARIEQNRKRAEEIRRQRQALATNSTAQAVPTVRPVRSEPNVLSSTSTSTTAPGRVFTSTSSTASNAPVHRPSPYFASNAPSLSTSTSGNKTISKKPVLDVNCYLIADGNRTDVLRLRFVAEAKYNEQFTKLCREMETRHWNNSEKTNSFELREYDKFQRRFNEMFDASKFKGLPTWIRKTFGRAFNGQELDPLVIPNLDFTDRIDPKVFDKLYLYQRYGVRYIISHGGRVLLADEMGLGKSAQALIVASYYRDNWPVLIICEANMRDTWKKNVQQWIPNLPASNCIVLQNESGAITANGTRKYVLVASYNMVSTRKDDIVKNKFGIVVVDESHCIKDFKSKRCDTVQKICWSSSTKRVLELSGTPTPSGPHEIYTQIKLLGSKLLSDLTYPKFIERYCDGVQKTIPYGPNPGQVIWTPGPRGATNSEEMNLLFRQIGFIKRTKAETITNELPKKIRKMFVLDKEIIREKYKKSIASVEKCQQLFSGGGGQSKRLEETSMLLYKHGAQAKADSVAEWLTQFVHTTLKSSEDKALVFAHHEYVLDVLQQALTIQKIKFIRIDGKTPKMVKQRHIDEFQGGSNVQVALLSITATNTGITLTAANHVVFAELWWTPGALIQAEDRAHRIGQTREVNVYYLVARGTCDDDIWNLIKSKLSVLTSANLANDTYSNTDTMCVPDSENEKEELAHNYASYSLTAYLQMMQAQEEQQLNASTSNQLQFDDSSVDDEAFANMDIPSDSEGADGESSGAKRQRIV